jgi:hypothetical protein
MTESHLCALHMGQARGGSLAMTPYPQAAQRYSLRPLHGAGSLAGNGAMSGSFTP